MIDRRFQLGSKCLLHLFISVAAWCGTKYVACKQNLSHGGHGAYGGQGVTSPRSMKPGVSNWPLTGVRAGDGGLYERFSERLCLVFQNVATCVRTGGERARAGTTQCAGMHAWRTCERKGRRDAEDPVSCQQKARPGTLNQRKRIPRGRVVSRLTPVYTCTYTTTHTWFTGLVHVHIPTLPCYTFTRPKGLRQFRGGLPNRRVRAAMGAHKAREHVGGGRDDGAGPHGGARRAGAY